MKTSGKQLARSDQEEFARVLQGEMAIPADSISRAIAYAIEQPAEAAINEIVIRPTAQDF